MRFASCDWASEVRTPPRRWRRRWPLRPCGFHFFLIVFLELRPDLSSLFDVERLRELDAVAIEGVGLEAQLPAQLVAVLDVFEGGLVGEVDGLGDRAADERLGRGHHADVAFDGDESLADFAALVGAVEDGQVLVLEVRRAFDGAAAADDVVGFVDLLLGEAESCGAD